MACRDIAVRALNANIDWKQLNEEYKTRKKKMPNAVTERVNMAQSVARC